MILEIWRPDLPYLRIHQYRGTVGGNMRMELYRVYFISSGSCSIIGGGKRGKAKEEDTLFSRVGELRRDVYLQKYWDMMSC